MAFEGMPRTESMTWQGRQDSEYRDMSSYDGNEYDDNDYDDDDRPASPTSQV